MKHTKTRCVITQEDMLQMGVWFRVAMPMAFMGLWMVRAEHLRSEFGGTWEVYPGCIMVGHKRWHR